MKRTRFLPAFLAALVAACSASQTSDPDAPLQQVGATTGPVTLLVDDSPSMAGVLFARPHATLSASAVTVQNTRYGSLCEFAVGAAATVSPTAIELHVKFAERLTSCVAAVRALSYSARVNAPPGAYDLVVIHDQNNVADTVLTQRVQVPK